MAEVQPVTVRLPHRALTLLQEAANVHGVSRHRIMEVVSRLAARGPDGIVQQALSESPNKRELGRIVDRVGRKA